MADYPSELVPLEAQISEVKRELRIRGDFYPRWIEAGKIKKHEADERMLAMRAVLETLLHVELERLEKGKI